MSPFDIPNVLSPILTKDIDYVSGTRFLEKENYKVLDNNIDEVKKHIKERI